MESARVTEARILVGGAFLRVGCKGRHHLIDVIHTTRPGEEYRFHVSKTLVEDSTDGRADLVPMIQLFAERCGSRVYYLSAERDCNTHPYCPGVTFRDRAGPGSRWIITRTPGDRYILESTQFRGYCLANDDGHLCLQRLSEARRSKHVNIFPIDRHHPLRRQWRHRSTSSLSNSTDGISGMVSRTVTDSTSDRTDSSIRHPSSSSSFSVATSASADSWNSSR